jgi:guanine deaminase
VYDYGRNAIISAGFLDSHVHFPQTPMFGAFAAQLLDWLNTYTFPTERHYADKEFAASVAKRFLHECVRNGITTSCVDCTVFPQSVDALFEEAERLGLPIAGGKVMMNGNARDYQSPSGPRRRRKPQFRSQWPAQRLLDTTQSSYDDSKALISRWHGRNPSDVCHFAPVRTDKHPRPG